MLVFHRTHHADAILREGFRDESYVLPGSGELRGVFVSADWPLDENEGTDGDAVLELEIPDGLFTEYEWVEEGKTYREAMIPARDLNACRSTLRELAADEIDALTDSRWRAFDD
jgi:hypothetical protein